jgi:hypothetical protein
VSAPLEPRDPWTRRLAVFACVLATIGPVAVTALLAAFLDERDRARGQICTWFEGDHLDDVQNLVNTYAFFEEQTVAGIRGSDFLLPVFLQMPETEGEALQDQAPAFCDEEGVAFPEPDPCYPERPAQVRHLAREFEIAPQPPRSQQEACHRLKPTLRG